MSDNLAHVPRRYARSRRRVSIYMAWSYPGEANRDVTEIDNRFATTTEVRRVLWPEYETPRFADPLRFSQGIAGSLELILEAWAGFKSVVEEVTGHVPPVFQRVDQAGISLPLDERVLDDADTLLVFGLDHNVTGQEPSTDEIEAVRDFLRREGTCLVVGPHHDVGATADMEQRAIEYAHHGDAVVPRQQRMGRYARSLLEGLGLPIENCYGLRPAVVPRTKWVAPLTVSRDLDTSGLLAGVENFNFHPHVPHYAVADGEDSAVVLATQPVDLSRRHPFTDAGARELNAVVWAPPTRDRAGDVLVADSTIFSTLFGRDESLERFWKNLASAS
jgi:hypothetical protein